MQSELLQALDDANSDKELFDAASAILVKQKLQGKDSSDVSFLLHSPLELSARFFLLPLVDENFTQGARAQIRRLARKYNDFQDSELRAAHVDFNPALIDVNFWVSSLRFAAHGPILLALHTMLGDTNEEIHNILARMDHDIMAGPQDQLKWASEANDQQELSADMVKHPHEWFIEHVGNIEKMVASTETIKGLVSTAQASGLLDPMLSKLDQFIEFSKRGDFEYPFKALLRIAVLSMILENDEHSKYGWTHCVTIPHSHWVLNKAGSSGHLIKSAATFVGSYRSLMGDNKIGHLDFEAFYEADEESVFAEHYVRMTDIISRACVLEDAHLVKYVYACFDLMKRDPQYSKLYIEAASKLLNLWEN